MFLAEDLRIDDCERCTAPHWTQCICDPRRLYRAPTPEEIEAAREERLARAERGRG